MSQIYIILTKRVDECQTSSVTRLEAYLFDAVLLLNISNCETYIWFCKKIVLCYLAIYVRSVKKKKIMEEMLKDEHTIGIIQNLLHSTLKHEFLFEIMVKVKKE